MDTEIIQHDLHPHDFALRGEEDFKFHMRTNSIFLGLAFVIIVRLMFAFLQEHPHPPTPPTPPSLMQTFFNGNNPPPPDTF